LYPTATPHCVTTQQHLDLNLHGRENLKSRTRVKIYYRKF